MADFNWMASQADRTGTLDVQSRGRELTDAEQAMASALEEIFASGCHDMADVASRLTAMNIAMPSGAASEWSVETLAAELATINAQLDAAFEEHGYGA